MNHLNTLFLSLNKKIILPVVALLLSGTLSSCSNGGSFKGPIDLGFKCTGGPQHLIQGPGQISGSLGEFEGNFQNPVALCAGNKRAVITNIKNMSGRSMRLTHSGLQALFDVGANGNIFNGFDVEGYWHASVSASATEGNVNALLDITYQVQ